LQNQEEMQKRIIKLSVIVCILSLHELSSLQIWRCNVWKLWGFEAFQA